MKQEHYDRLSEKDKAKIDSLLEKGSKKKRKKEYSMEWLYGYLDESFKNWENDTFHGVIDYLEMMKQVHDIAGLDRIKSDIEYLIKYHLKYYFENATTGEKRRCTAFCKSINLSQKEVNAIIKEDD